MASRYFRRLLPLCLVLPLSVAGLLAQQSASTEGGADSLPAAGQEVAQEDASEKDGTVSSGEDGELLAELRLDGDGLARIHRFDGEETAVLSIGSTRNMVMAADHIVSRNFYDQDYRLESRFTWEFDGNEAKEGDEAAPVATLPRLVSQEEYFYYEESPHRQLVVTKDFRVQRRQERHFSPEGLLVKEEWFRPRKAEGGEEGGAQEAGGSSHNSDDGGERGQGAAPVPLDVLSELELDFTREYQYDDESLLTAMDTIHYGDGGEIRERTVYHQPGNIHGGHDFFEDGRLLVSRRYHEPDQYTETRYFDGMEMVSKYQGARLLSEVLYIQGKEVRRREF